MQELKTSGGPEDPMERYFQVHPQVALRVSSYGCGTRTTHRPPLVILGGLATVIDAFRPLLSDLSRDFPVHYLETREKHTSRITGWVGFDVPAMGADLPAVIRQLGLRDRGYVLAGYSLGAAVVADAYKHLASKPRWLVLAEPTPVLHLPWWGPPLVRWLGVPLYPVLRVFAQWYLRTFRIDVEEDPEIACITERALRRADPRKLRDCLLANAGYAAWDELAGIDCPTLLVTASLDTLHVLEDAHRMQRTIPDCRTVDLMDNRRTHQAEMGCLIRDFLDGYADGR
ncbi:MAG: hypothetical protein RLY31_302 [Bacteroidota bacterium]